MSAQIKTKEFNLEEVLRTGKAVTRDGHLVVGLHDDGVYLIGHINGHPHDWTKDGIYVYGKTHHLDLFCLSETPQEEPEMYVNVYEDNETCWPGELIYPSSEIAFDKVKNRKAGVPYKGTYRLTKVNPPTKG